MGLVSKLWIFAFGGNADPTQVNSDFDTLYTLVNGNIDEANLKPYAVSSKIGTELSIINVKAYPYNAKGDGVTDDTAAIQAAITAAANGILNIPTGTYMISSQLVISNPMIANIFGTIKPSTTGVAGTALVSITSSNVHIYGNRMGMLDGNSKNWCGISATNTTAVIENVTLEEMLFQNIAVNAASAYAVNWASVKNGLILRNTFKNCGMVGNVTGSGFGIYSQFCQNLIIKDNVLDTVGSTAINSSANINTLIEGNTVYKATLFGIKGGYGITAVLTADVAPTLTTFSIAKNSTNTTQWFVGTAFVIILSNTTKTTGIVKAITDNGTYYTITSTTMDTLPVVGKSTEIFEYRTKVINNSITYTGNTSLDWNVVKDLTIRGNHILFGGWYQDVGTYLGLNSAVWVGADPQGAVTCLESFNVLIEGNTIEQTYGSGICTFLTNNVTVQGNTIKECNTSNTAAYGGIEVGRVGILRSTNVSIKNNTIESTLGYGIYASYYTNGDVAKNTVKCAGGIVINATVATLVDGNTVETLAANASSLLIQDATGANPNNTVLINGNSLRNDGATTVGVNVTDTAAALITLTEDNTISGTTPIFNASSNPLIRRGSFVTLPNVPVVAAASQVNEGYYDNFLDPAVTDAIGSFIADNGTAGMMVIEGTAWQGTNAEGFRMVIQGGMNATTVKTLTLYGPSKGVTWLAAGDFTLAVGGDSMTTTISFKNNALARVRVQMKIVSYSRY